MGRKAKIGVVGGALLAAFVAGVFFASRAGYEFYEVDHEDVKGSDPSDLLADDKLEDKNPAFDPELIDSRPFGGADNPWQINASAAVIKLDVPDLRDDSHAAMQRLYPSYVDAAQALKDAGFEVLPSVNLIGGKAKQFDDGLYAALDLYMARNVEEGVRDIELCVRAMLTEMNPTSETYAWLWASLEVGGYVAPDEYAQRPPRADEYVRLFMLSPAAEPAGFYVWNEPLQRVFRFLRYLQQPFNNRARMPDDMARALRRSAQAREQYERMLSFYTRLSNPFAGLSLLDLENEGSLQEIAAALGRRHSSVAFLPSSDAKETALFERLYPGGLPAGADLMRDLIKAIRDGRIDLAPGEDSGWYDHQLYALETLVLPERGRESERLLLTRKYKLRLIEAFKSMVTKSRETHIRQMSEAAGSAAPPSETLSPRLRLEPNPTYYLRMARSYEFLSRFLGEEVHDLDRLVGLSATGTRGQPLGLELERMRVLFYGLYLISCEDIGMSPQLDVDAAEADLYSIVAGAWLDAWLEDADLAVDTRVAVPVYQVPQDLTRFWCTLGVRPMLLEAEYVKPPSWRAAGTQEWTPVPSYRTEAKRWVILGDEFGEVEMRQRTLSRAELRMACDEHKTREAILAWLNRQ